MRRHNYEVKTLSKYSAHDYQSRVEFSQKIFFQIESSMTGFLEYVPLDFNHLEVYSSRLITIILEIGPELINSFDLAVFHRGNRGLSEVFDDNIRKYREKLLIREKKLRSKKRSLTFKDYYFFLDETGYTKLSRATIRLTKFDVFMLPFENINPDWWESYNLLRHDKYNNLKRATLRNTLKALAALFWLICYNWNRVYSNEFISSDLFSRTDLYEIDQSSIRKI